MRLRTSSALLCALLFTWPATAQEQRGSIEGVVKDNTGAILAGVAIEARSLGGGALSTTSDAKGTFRFPSVLPGTYEVNARMQNFKPSRVSNVIVGLGQIKTVEISLQLASMAEQVTVTAESPVIDVKQSARSTNIRDEQVRLLPHGRDFTTLVIQASGANNEAKSGGISIDGASASENRYVVDGIETTELVHGTSGKNVLADFIEEVQVKSSGYTAEYGGSTGGVINVITKSGTNHLAGNALLYWEGSRLNGASNNTLRLNPTNSSVAEYIRYPKDETNRFEPGGAVGGPLMKDRSWFFAAYQPALTTTNRTVSPQTSGLATASTISKTTKARVQYLTANQTAQIGDKLRTRVAFTNSWSKTSGQLPSLGGTDNPLSNFTKGTTRPNWTLSGSADYILNPKLFFGVRAGRFLSNEHDFNVPTEPRITWGSGTQNVGFVGTNGVAVPTSLQRAGGFTSVLSNTAVDHDKLARTMAQIDGTWYAHAGGDHQVRGGLQIDRRSEDIVSGELGNLVTVRWGLPLSSGVPLRQGPFGYYEVRSNGVDPKKGFITQGNVSSNLVGFFVQDAWTVSNRFTINAGIRSEQEKVPAFTSGADVPKYPITFSMKDKFAPRLGFAYDVKGDGRWKAYGSWGIFYDIFKLELPQGSFGGQKWLSYYYTLDTPDWQSLVTGAGCPPACSGTLIRGPIDFRSVSLGSDAIEPNLKPMKSQEAAFGIEHQLGGAMAVSARYVHKQIDRAIEDTGSLDAQGNELYVVANPGEGLTELAFTNPKVNLPKGKRNYDGIELAWDKRYADNWALSVSYLFSRLNGNYPGLSQSDENGRVDPNVGRLFDYPLMMFTQAGQPSYGPLPTDRPHQVKVQAIYQFKFGTSVGLNQYLESGIPITRELAVLPTSNYPIQYLGRGSDGRTPMFSQTDVYVQHNVKLGGRVVQLQLNVLNLFNQRAAVNRFSTLNRGNGITFDEAAFYRSGFNFDQLATQQNIVRDARFLMDNGYQSPISARVGVKFTF